MASTLVALQTITVGAGGASSVTFSSIPQTYNDLVVKANTRGTYTGSNWIAVLTTFNGLGNSNYNHKLLYGTGSAAGSEQYSNSSNGPSNFFATTDSCTANTFGNAEIYITNYTNTENFKAVSTDFVTETNATAALTGLNAMLWSIPTKDPITSIAFTPGSGNFVQYSTFTLYGVYNSPLETAVEAPTIGTATAASTGANVAFTPSGTGAPATSYVATSSPGGITATGYTSPILVTGLTSGTAYTFTVKGQNPGGTGAASAASNSVTPYDGYESIASVTVGSGGSSTVTFSSIPQTFTHLQIRGIGKNTGTTAGWYDVMMNFNGDTAQNYQAHVLSGNGTAASSGWSGNAFGVQVGNALPTSATGETSMFGAMVIDILDYANTSKYTTTRHLYGWDKNGSGQVKLGSGSWRNTAAITSIVLTTDTNAIAQYSTFELFGIR